MKLLQTADLSYTFYNEKYQEPYHTKSGAIEEALEKHVKPAGIKNGSVILDFCFGLGYNSLVALSLFDNLKITALENDTALFQYLHTIQFENSTYQTIYTQLIGQVQQQLALGKTQFDVIIKTSVITFIFGDAKQTIQKLTNTFDAVFFDPFSPQKQPEMWTKEIFSHCRRVLREHGILTTYSYARLVRDNMKKAGLSVKDGPVVGRRSPSTIGVNLKDSAEKV